MNNEYDDEKFSASTQFLDCISQFYNYTIFQRAYLLLFVGISNVISIPIPDTTIL